MKNELFQQLLESMNEAKDILDGKITNHRVTEITPEQSKQMMVELDKHVEEDILNATQAENKSR